jgi:hypothetical protein
VHLARQDGAGVMPGSSAARDQAFAGASAFAFQVCKREHPEWTVHHSRMTAETLLVPSKDDMDTEWV